MEHLTVKILGRDYRLSCQPDERDKLLAAVAHVDTSMQTIRDQGKIAAAERIAVLAALNIAGDLLSHARPAAATSVSVDTAVDTEQKTSVADPEIVRRMQAINALLDTTLADQERLF